MAEIQKYRQANVQVGNIGGGAGDAGMLASAQGKQSLSQKLNQFSSNMMNMAGTMAQDQGAKDAVVDIRNRKKKVAEINAKPLTDSYTETDRQAEIGKITEGTARKFSGIYSRAYENAAASSYSSQIKSDAKSAYDLAMVESQGDPEMFMAMYSKFSQESVRGAPTPATAVVAQETTLNYGTAGFKSLMMARSGASTAQHKTQYKSANEAMAAQFSDAYYQNDSVAQARIFSEINQAGEAAVRDGLISQEEFEVNSANIAQNAMIDAVKRGFGEELNVGRGDLAYQQFIMNERKGFYEGADPDETAKIKSSMLSQIKEFNDASLERQRFEAKQHDAMSLESFNDGVQQIAQGQMTSADIDYMEQQGVINLVHAKQLRERLAIGKTAMVSDAQTLANYAESSTLIDTEPYMIQQDPTLSVQDQNALIQRRETLLEGRFNWTKTNDGREAVRRIKEEFGIREGTLLAKIDMENTINKDFNNLYKKFYAEVSASPQPDMDVLPIADRMLEEYTQLKLDEQEAQKTAQKEAQVKNAQRLKDIDDKAFHFPWWDEKPLEHYMLQE